MAQTFHPQIVFAMAALIGTVLIAVIWVHPRFAPVLGRRIPLFNGKVRG